MEHKRGNGDPFPKKIQFTRYNYSFHARLIQASPEVQSYYTVILTAVRSCPQMRVTFGWRQVYVHIRRRQVAQMVFKGQTLCIALAIDPVTCGESKRRVEDVSRFKRFAKTPLMVRLVSRLRLRSALTLLETAAGVGALPRPDVAEEPLYDYRTTEELIELGLVKVLSRAASEETAASARRTQEGEEH